LRRQGGFEGMFRHGSVKLALKKPLGLGGAI
jgi:hypothetical protein